MDTKTIKIPYSKNNLSKLSTVQLKILNGEIQITGIPETDSLEYLAESAIDKYQEKKSNSKDILIVKQKDVSGVYYVVHGPGDYKKLRVHIGLENELEEAKVYHIDRYFDGGTTIIRYAINSRNGSLTFPAQHKKISPTDKYDTHTIQLTDLLRK